MIGTIITGFSNPTKEGITIHLNKPSRLKNGTGHFKEFWISWDKIGDSLFDDYVIGDPSELNKERIKHKKP